MLNDNGEILKTTYVWQISTLNSKQSNTSNNHTNYQPPQIHPSWLSDQPLLQDGPMLSKSTVVQSSWISLQHHLEDSLCCTPCFSDHVA